jgi:hypothetical protein
MIKRLTATTSCADTILKGLSIEMNRWLGSGMSFKVARMALALLALSWVGNAATTPTIHHVVHRRAVHSKRVVTHHVVRRATTRTGVLASIEPVTVGRKRTAHRVFFSPWTEPTYADSTFGDSIDGEDLVARV